MVLNLHMRGKERATFIHPGIHRGTTSINHSVGVIFVVKRRALCCISTIRVMAEVSAQGPSLQPTFCAYFTWLDMIPCTSESES